MKDKEEGGEGGEGRAAQHSCKRATAEERNPPAAGGTEDGSYRWRSLPLP